MFVSSTIRQNLLILVVLLFFVLPLEAQESKTDSLEVELQTVQGINRIPALLEITKLLSHQEAEKAIKYGEETRELWTDVDLGVDKTGSHLFELGSAYQMVSMVDSVWSIASQLKELEQERGANYFKGILLEGLFFTSKGEYNEALSRFKLASNFFKDSKSKELLSYSLRQEGSVYYNLSKYDLGIDFLQQSLEIDKEIGDKSGEATDLQMLGKIQDKQGNKSDAKINYKKSLELFEEVNDIEGIAGILNSLGIMEAKEGNYDASFELFVRARDIYEITGDKPEYVRMLNNMGIIYDFTGKYDSSLLLYHKVHELSIEMDHKPNQALALSNLGSVNNNIGKYDIAYPFLESALELYEEMEDKYGISRVLNNMSTNLMEKGMLNEAIQLLERSLAIKEEIGIQSSIALTLTNIAEIYLLNKNYSKSEDYFVRALNIRIDLEDKKGQVYTYFGLSKLLKEKGWIEEAIAVSDTALNIATDIKYLLTVRDLHEYRSNLFSLTEQYEKALESHVAFKAMHDSLFTTESESVIAELQQKYKTKEQEQQIELLEQGKRIQNLRVGWLIVGILLLTTILVLLYNRYQLKNSANKIIQEKSDQLEKYNTELLELSEFKQGMTNMIVHDIKNPLNSIIGMSRVVKNKSSECIFRAGEMILRLITNMLDVEKFENTKPELNLEKVQLSKLIDEANLAVETLLHDKSIALQLELEHDCVIEVDRDLFTRVLINLLSNAIKFSPSNEKITIGVNYFEKDRNGSVEIIVTDKGIGIPKNDQPYIFEKFYQSKAKNSGRLPSTGLGLTFCKLVVSAHHGKIKVESNQGHGSSFIVTLKIVELLDSAGLDNQIVDNEISILEEDKEYLRSYSKRLRELKVHNVNSISQILNEIEALKFGSQWVGQVRSAVRYSNKIQYQSLIEMID